MSAHARTSVRVTVSVNDGERTEHHELDAMDGRVSIGRDPRCTVPLTTAFASRQHLIADVRGSSMKVRDTSMNGTYVGGVLVKQQEVDVPFGTAIAIGPFTVVLERACVPSLLPAALPKQKPRLVTPSAAPAPPEPVVTPTTSTAVVAAAVAAGKLVSGSVEIARVDAWAEENAVRVEVHKRLLEHLDLGAVDAARADDPTLRPKVLAALRAIVSGLGDRVPVGLDRDVLVGSLLDEAIGLGPIERFLSDPNVNEIMVVDPNTIFLEMAGKMVRADARFTNDDRVRATIERIVTPLGRRIDESVPLVDARLADGSRVNAVIKPLALRGAAITIRKFSRKPFTMDRLVELGALTDRMAQFLLRSVTAKKNIVISGGTGSGKTTLLNVLSGAIPEDERIVTIEDAAELQLRQPHVVSLETRPSNMEGKGEYTIRDLVKNALRMRPDRIVVGECRGGEALDMLQAMNTGHDGSLTTTHANSPREAVARLETLVLMAGLELPVRAIREQIAGSIQLIVQQSRLSDGTRRVTAISEVVGISDRGDVELVPIFEYVRTGTGPKGKIIGDYRATGFLPTFLNDFLVMGLVGEDEAYL
ncbi:MAG: Type secretion system hydrolase TadA/VirB11/CpaF, TadA subfamily [Myxococcaceae bacterium]|nr:Type secretion system hydrolase TadA/VirB11/CpaF, TadA subfamily [Myxococcaceae bacterium]